MDKLKPGDKGWKPSTPFGQCPCCGSVLMWAHDINEGTYLDDTAKYSGEFFPIDIRYLDHIRDVMLNLGMVKNDLPPSFVSMLQSLVSHALQPWRYEISDQSPPWMAPVAEQVDGPIRRIKLPKVELPFKH